MLRPVRWCGLEAEQPGCSASRGQLAIPAVSRTAWNSTSVPAAAQARVKAEVEWEAVLATGKTTLEVFNVPRADEGR